MTFLPNVLRKNGVHICCTSRPVFPNHHRQNKYHKAFRQAAEIETGSKNYAMPDHLEWKNFWMFDFISKRRLFFLLAVVFQRPETLLQKLQLKQSHQEDQQNN